jgi:hypothetical protein
MAARRRDLDYAAVFEAQHGEHEGIERGLAGTAEVTGGAGLSVGHDRQPPPLAEGGPGRSDACAGNPRKYQRLNLLIGEGKHEAEKA